VWDGRPRRSIRLALWWATPLVGIECFLSGGPPCFARAAICLRVAQSALLVTLPLFVKRFGWLRSSVVYASCVFSMAVSSGVIAPMTRSSSIAGRDWIRTDAASAAAACMIQVM
jgi:hypothetical protein